MMDETNNPTDPSAPTEPPATDPATDGIGDQVGGGVIPQEEDKNED